MSSRYEPKTPFARAIHDIEETAIAVILGLMAVITFANVVVRYVFNGAVGQWFESTSGVELPGSIIWGLEVVLVLFAWLVLLGISYGFKVTAHLGVDAVTNLFEPDRRRTLALIAAACCFLYAFLLMKGAWDYWAPFVGLDATSGRWFPTGFENTRDRAWFETDQIPMPGILRWMEDVFNQGEEYEKLPRLLPYAMLPFAAALTLLRVVQAFMAIRSGRQDSMIVSHEAEEAVEEVAAANR